MASWPSTGQKATLGVYLATGATPASSASLRDAVVMIVTDC